MTRADWRDLVVRLEAYGVPAQEGRLYFHLSLLGGARAAELAKAAGVPRTDAYRLLEQLEERGMVEKTLERPARYLPVPIQEVLQRALQRRRRALDELADAQDALARAWPQEHGLGAGDRRIAVHQGRHQIQGLLERLVAGAHEDVTVFATLRGIAHLDLDAILARLRERAEAGVPVRFLTRVEAPDLPLLRRLAEIATVRHVDLHEFHEMVIADTHHIALFVGGTQGRDPDGGRETLLSLTAPPFVMAQKALADEAWQRGIDLAARVRELEEGRIPERVELLRGRWMRTERLKQMLYRNDALTVQAPAAEVRRWDAAGVLRVLRHRIDQGCIVRVLTDGDVDLPGVPVRRVADARVLMATDGRRELLVVEGCDDAGGLTNEAEWGTWSSLPGTVALGAGHLEARWKDAANLVVAP